MKSPLTKEQVAQDYKRAQARKLIKERFYPALVEATISVDEAGMLLQAATSLIMEEAMEKLRSTPMKDIKSRMVKKLAPNDERVLQIEKLLEVFDNHTLFDARWHFESMRAVLEQMKTDEFQKRKLDTMTPDWERYLK